MATEILRPNAEGDENHLYASPNVDHYLNVDEETHDGDSTYNYSQSTNRKDLYHLPSTAISGNDTINSVTLKAYVRARTYYSNYSGWIGIKTHATEYWGDYIEFPENYTLYTRVYNNNPNTSSAWTVAELNALQIGAQTYVAMAGLELTQIFVEVDYTPGVEPVELAGSSAGVASVSGLAVVTYALAGISQGVASVSGLAGIMRWLAGASSGVCSTAADLWLGVLLKALSAGVASVTGSVLITRGLAGVSSGITSTAGSLTIRGIKWLAGVSSGVASVSGFTSISRKLAGAIAGVATVSGSLFHVRRAIRELSAVRNLAAARNIPPVR